MENERINQWLTNSFLAINGIEMLLIGEVQALGELDVELLEDSNNVKIHPVSDEDLRIKRRHLLLSKLWVLGAYELVRFVNDLDKDLVLLNEISKSKLKEALSTFTKLRVPLAKFQKSGGNKDLYESVANSFFDNIKGVGWKVYTHEEKELKKEIFYRRDLGDLLLNLLKEMKEGVKI